MTVFLMSILYLFLCLLQFHTDTDDSAVLIEKYSSVAKSSSSEDNFTEYPNWEQQRNYIQLLTDFHKSVEFGLYLTTLDSRCQGRYVHHKIPYNSLGSYGFSTEDTVQF